MRFIGNKANLMDKIYQIIQKKGIKGNSFFDFFSGTASAGKYFKRLGYKVYSSDLLYFSYVLQKAYLVNNEIPRFEKLLPLMDNSKSKLFNSPLEIVITYLNNLNPLEGFIFKNFTPGGTSYLDIQRKYFTDNNGMKIDSIRLEIENWKNQNLINESEYFVLLSCLIETVPFYANISGVYAAFQKNWDPRAIKNLSLRPIEIIINKHNNFAYNTNSLNLLNNIETDILYIDPPYNQRQYAPNYHILETIAKYDNPVVKGISGLRPYENQKSNFCNANTGIEDLKYIVENGNYRFLVLSYNSEGIIPSDEIKKLFSDYGETDFLEFENLRYKSNNNGESKTKKFVKEYLFILSKITKAKYSYGNDIFRDPRLKVKCASSHLRNMKSNLWLLTEERPKTDVIKVIIAKFFKDNKISGFIDTLRILPILKEDKFTFTYEVYGIKCKCIDKIFIKIISGYSSFVDYLMYYQNNEPVIEDKPIYAIEETKTDDKESRNTGVFQRASKFIYLDKYYPGIKKIMLYNLQVEQKEKPTDTYIFGTKLLINLGVEVIGKKLDNKTFCKFKSVDEVIDFKNKMRKAHKGNVPIKITKFKNKIEISGRLIKSGRLSHDPNIGSLTLISAVLRKLGWNKEIVITKHGLKQNNVGKNNKFVQIANLLNIKLEKLIVPVSSENLLYWKYETEGEKLGTIFIHVVVENFTDGYSIFENHAGCEKGYFYTKDGIPLSLKKYKDRIRYKDGDTDEIVHIPDLILIDFGKLEIINIEGKKYQFRIQGINELKNYSFIEKNYIQKNYPEFKITRTVVLYGSNERKIIEIEVGFLLNENGFLILGIKAPNLFKNAIKNLIDYWS